MAMTSDGFKLRCSGPAIDEATACRPALRSYCWLYRSGYGSWTGVNAGLYPRMNIHLTSHQFNVKDGDGILPIDQYMTVHLSEMPDYEEACRSGFKTKKELKSLMVEDSDEDSDEDSEDACMKPDGASTIMDERLLTLLARKFYYAGGSARFMFDHTLKHLVKGVFPILLKQISKLWWQDFATLSMYASSDTTVNSLMQVLGSTEVKQYLSAIFCL